MTRKLALCGGTPVRTKPFPQWPIFGEEEEQALIRTLRSGKWGRLDGSEVARFERDFADYHQAKHAIAVVNGTVSLQIALLAAGIQAGDEVIVPPYTFLSTASAVVAVNATPIFVDVELDTFNIDLKLVEAAITPRNASHHPRPLWRAARGHGRAARHRQTAWPDGDRRRRPCARSSVQRASCRRHRTNGVLFLPVVQEPHQRRGRDHSHQRRDLAERCRSIHNCGRIPGGMWYDHHVISGNYRLGEFQGAVLNAQFARFDAQADTRERNGKYLAERLARIPGVLPQPRTADCTRHGYHLFLLRLDSELLGISREAFLKALVAEGIPAIAGYARGLERQPLFTNLAFGPYQGYQTAQPQLDYRKMRCPNCENSCSSQAVWLEQRLLLGTQQDMDDIADACRENVSRTATNWQSPDSKQPRAIQ